MDIIKSKDNSKIKYVRSLSSKKFRDEEHTFVVEGIKFANEALKEKADIKYVVISESALNKTEVNLFLECIKENSVDLIACDDNVFNSIADTINAQGVLAVINKKNYFWEETLKEYNFIIMCDRIQDPGNLGTIIRTADAFGPAAVILNKGCVDAYNAKVVRASAGAIFRIPIIQSDLDFEILQELKQASFNIISTVVDSTQSFEDIICSDRICVIIGNEGQGVSQEIINESHMSITIKMSGRAESLNASIAAGISIYEIRKKLL
ncbi:MAG: TrmH family RNA methyltransferase [Sedimentibacter sp.]